jgi:trehalose synthase-fused probable maltokinase
MSAHAALALPLVTIDSWDRPFEQRTLYQIEPILPAFVAARRWFRSKARAIQCIAIDDALPLASADSCILVLRIQYADGACDHYLLPLFITEHAESDELLAQAVGPDGVHKIICGALANPQFRDALLNAIRCEEKFEGHAGEFIAFRTSAFADGCADRAPVESFVSRAEQSNTSVIYRDRYILKLFRKIEPGVNPDLEIGTFLTGRGFEHTPAVLGTLEYRAKGGDAVSEYAAGILQEFVPNEGDAWKYTLESLSGFFARAQSVSPPSQHPLDLMHESPPEEARTLIGGYFDAARLLGRRTAELHAALADPGASPDFAPEPFTREDAEKLHQEMLGQADITFELIRRKEAVLTGRAADAAREVLHIEHRVTERFLALRDRLVDAVRIRYHGDYHLGQVLWTGSDFMIIDFEGEPARPLADRRTKTLAMRDVAGMIRSFQYAAYAAAPPDSPDVASSADYWTAWVGAAYLSAYFNQAAGQRFVPRDPSQQKIVFDAFVLQKALYEVAYELNNRPDWVQIPLKGILSLMS